MVAAAGSQPMLVLANLTPLRVATFQQRVEVAAAAGFTALGLSLTSYRQILATGLSPREVRAILDGNGVRVAELEVIIGFAADPETGGGAPDTRGGSLADLDEYLAMAELFGARHLQTVGSFRAPIVEPDVIERFAALCDRAADVGLKVALEFIPTTNVPDAATANWIVTEAGRPNGGVCVDVWHHVRGANDLALLRAIDRAHLVSIQLDDGPIDRADPDFRTETLHYRNVPDEGQFDLDAFLAALGGADPAIPVSVEVLSDELAAADPVDAARRLVTGTKAVLARSQPS